MNYNKYKDKKEYLKVHLTIGQHINSVCGSLKPYVIFLKMKSMKSNGCFKEYKGLYKELGISRNTFKKYLNILMDLNYIKIEKEILMLSSYDAIYCKNEWKFNGKDLVKIKDNTINNLNTEIQTLIIKNTVIYCNRIKNEDVLSMYKHVLNTIRAHSRNELSEKINEFKNLNLNSKYQILLRALFTIKKNKINQVEFKVSDKRFKRDITISKSTSELIQETKEKMQTINSVSTKFLSKVLDKKSQSTISKITRRSQSLGLLTIKKNSVLAGMTIKEFNLRNEMEYIQHGKYYTKNGMVFKRMPNSYFFGVGNFSSLSDIGL